MERENKKSGFLSTVGGLLTIFLLFGLFALIFKELKKGNILMWIYLIAVVIYVCIYGEAGLT